MLKTYLLSLGCFLDNEYLEEYLLLIEQPSSFFDLTYTEDHHIIPKSYYKFDYSKTATTEDIALKDPHNKLVKLTYSDHFYAHWLLYKCTTNKLKSSNAKAVLAMSGKPNILNFSKDQILQICLEIKQNSNFYWSSEEDAILVEMYKNGTIAELDAISSVLSHRTTQAIRGRISRLGLSDRIWTTEDEIWLKLNYKTLGKVVCAQHLNRTLEAIEHKVTKLQISNRLWSEDEVTWLMANYATTPTVQCAEFLNRSPGSITAKAASLNLAKATHWTTFEESWLQEHKPDNTWQFCSEYLDRSISSIKQKAHSLKIPNDYLKRRAKSVYCLETSEIFSSVKQACRKYGQGVQHNLQGRHKSVGGLHFEYYAGEKL